MPTKAAKAKAGAIIAVPAPASLPDVNTDYFTELGKATQNVTHNDIFKNIREHEPSQFCMDDYKKGIKARGQYTCAGNMAWSRRAITLSTACPSH